jgi:hypothetical protein
VEEFENAAPLKFAIKDFLQEAGITFIGVFLDMGKRYSCSQWRNRY